MFALTLIIHIFLGSTLAGSAIVAALSAGYDTLAPIVIAGGAGFVLAFPVSWYIARSISGAVVAAPKT